MKGGVTLCLDWIEPGRLEPGQELVGDRAAVSGLAPVVPAEAEAVSGAGHVVLSAAGLADSVADSAGAAEALRHLVRKKMRFWKKSPGLKKSSGQ